MQLGENEIRGKIKRNCNYTNRAAIDFQSSKIAFDQTAENFMECGTENSSDFDYSERRKFRFPSDTKNGSKEKQQIQSDFAVDKQQCSKLSQQFRWNAEFAVYKIRNSDISLGKIYRNIS